MNMAGTGLIRIALWWLLVFNAAASQPTIRLAILVEDSKLSSVADLLTVELSHKKQLALLERAQINKVRKEQALSASFSRDYIKLGELLGADGVLVLDVVEKGCPGYPLVRTVIEKQDAHGTQENGVGSGGALQEIEPATALEVTEPHRFLHPAHADGPGRDP